MAKSFMIEQWMTGGLGLSGNELVLFAIIWKESKKGEQAVDGDYEGLSQAMGVSVPTLYSCIKRLTERGVIVSPRKGVYAIADNLKVA